MKVFLVRKSISEVINLVKLSQRDFIYSIKIDLPEEIKILGNKTIFQGLLLKVLKNATKNYLIENSQNRIILITSKIENPKTISFSATSGGKGLTFLKRTIGKKSFVIFREKNSDCDIYQINKIIKKEFRGRLEIISKKNKGSTFKCYFPLNQ